MCFALGPHNRSIRFDQPIECACDLLSDHRLAYLDYEGEIEAIEASVMRLLRGTYRLIDNADDQFVAELCWDEGDRRSRSDGEDLSKLASCGFTPGRKSRLLEAPILAGSIRDESINRAERPVGFACQRSSVT